MFETLHVRGPAAPGQYGAMQVAGPAAYYPYQATDMTGIFSSMMPMMKGIAAPAA